ncbi:hypothetical protein BH24CHL9_BH24CHL9_11530 [soil metagenome]
MSFSFLKRRKEPARGAPQYDPGLLFEEPEAEDYELKLIYRAKSSKGVRMAPGVGAVRRLPVMMGEFAKSEIELVEPLDPQFADATPQITRTIEASQWLNAHHARAPITRHALMVFESLDAIDPNFESAAFALLAGERDARGYPDFDGILGGVVSYWDEVTGDQIVRGLVGWGGRGVRGDSERMAVRLLGGLLAGILASHGAVGIAQVERPLPAEAGGGLVCTHCQFAQVARNAFFCPNCGMRMLRG